MELDILDILKACRRSRVKVRVWRGLVELRVAVVPELAEKAQTTPDRVLAVLHGDGRKYRQDSSLVTLGLARPTQPDEQGRYGAYALTRRGEAAWEPVLARLTKTRGPPAG